MLSARFPGEKRYSANTPPSDVYERWTRTPPAVVVQFVSAIGNPYWSREFVDEWLTPIWASGCVPLVTWEPLLEYGPSSNRPVAVRISNGEHEAQIRNWARQLAEWATAGNRSRRFYFRPAHEMNGNWYRWATVRPNTTPEDYVRMWRYIHSVFDRTALTSRNIQWMWSVNAADVGEHKAEQYYPGDEYVDWIGVDGYNFGDGKRTRWIAPDELFDPMLDRVESLTNGSKPIAIPEFASSSFKQGRHRPAAKAAWIEAAYELIRERDLRMAGWFDFDKETDWGVLGGQYGTSTVSIDGTRYNAYEAFRTAVTHDSVLRGGHRPAISDAQFAGVY